MNWHQVAAMADVPEDGTLLVDVGVEPVCLYNVSGAIHATHNTCTHGQASLSDGFIVDGEKIECPLHQGMFEIRTGRAVGAPCAIDIKVYPVRVEDGTVYVAEG